MSQQIPWSIVDLYLTWPFRSIWTCWSLPPSRNSFFAWLLRHPLLFSFDPTGCSFSTSSLIFLLFLTLCELQCPSTQFRSLSCPLWIHLAPYDEILSIFLRLPISFSILTSSLSPAIVHPTVYFGFTWRRECLNGKSRSLDARCQSSFLLPVKWHQHVLSFPGSKP